LTRLVVTDDAAKDLRRLVEGQNLPASTHRRFRDRLAALQQFPEMGAPLGGRFAGRRFVLGPWPWMIVVYRYHPERNLVSILTVVDGRSSESPTAAR